MMKVSVLMPVYSTPVDWCRQAVESILSQSYRDFSYIIVDDNNPRGDLTEYLYSLYTDERTKDCLNIVRRDENTGIAAALDTGLEACTGDIIIRMDADDIAHRTLIQKHVEFFTMYPARNICGIQIKLFDEGRNWRSYHPRVVTREMALNDPGFWFINHPGVAYRKSVIMSLGGYGNISQNLPEDYALWIKFLKAGHVIYNREEILMDYRVHPKSFSFAPDRKASSWHEFLHKQRESLRDV